MILATLSRRWTSLGLFLGAWVLALDGACGPARTSVVGEVNPNTRTLIVGLTQNGQLHASVLPVDQPLELELPTGFSESEPFVVSRIQLQESMTELGLIGPLLHAAPPPNRPVSALDSLVTEVAALKPGDVAQFSIGAIAPELAELRVVDPRPCPGFGFEPEPDPLAFSQGTVNLADGRGLLAALEGIVVLSEEGVDRVLRFPSEQIYQVALDPNGEVWVLTSASLARVDVQTGGRTRLLDTRTLSAGSAGLIVTSADPLRAFVLTPTGYVHLVEESGITLHQELSRQYMYRPSIDRAWLRSRGGDSFFAGAHYFTALAEYDGTSYSYFAADGVNRGFAGVGQTRDGRFIIVDGANGNVFVEAGDEWAPGPKLTTRVFSFAPFGGGGEMFYVSNDGLVGVFTLDGGRGCDPVTVGNFSGVRDVVRVGARFFISGTLADNTSLHGWLVPL